MTSSGEETRPLALVTGASTGIGRAVAAELAERGFDLVIAADEARVVETAEELRELTGAAVLPVEVDLATPAGVERLHERVGADGRVPTAAVLNAGIGVSGRFDRTSLADHLRLVDLNVRSTVHLAGLVLSQMVPVGRGRLMVTSSVAAVAPGPYQSTYAASKAFVHSFAEAIRTELDGTGVTVTSLMPGPTDTDFFARAGMDTTTKLGRTSFKDDPAKVAAQAVDAMLDGRAHLVPGSVVNRVQAELGTHLPDRLAAPLLGWAAKPDRPEADTGPG